LKPEETTERSAAHKEAGYVAKIEANRLVHSKADRLVPVKQMKDRFSDWSLAPRMTRMCTKGPQSALLRRCSIGNDLDEEIVAPRS